uniref:SH2 domain-containing protein n=1 Tax=Xiphophorus couchianus TaxID=32473 RepID=A0A3B5LCH3_9TELE
MSSNYVWYVGGMRRKEAEELLKGRRDGTFLIRDISSHLLVSNLKIYSILLWIIFISKLWSKTMYSKVNPHTRLISLY